MGTSAFTGMIADFAAPVAPAGWLELDGSTISTSTYSALFGVMSISTSGTRNNGSPVITSIPSTSSFKVGYFVFGTGIASGTTILSIDSGTQITLSGNASSTGSGTFTVSPWSMNTGTITLPDVTTAGRYRRSRTSSTAVGQLQADQNQSHTHTATTSGTTDTVANHTHSNSLTDPGHAHVEIGSIINSGGGSGTMLQASNDSSNVSSASSNSTANATTGITITNAAAGSHSHTVTGTATIANQGGTEARPLTLIVLTCVKT